MDFLTVGRLFAALWVILYHLKSFGLFLVPEHSFGFGSVISSGYLGVQFFFILSGFILTHVYGGTEPIHFRNFIVARIARIFPLHLVALAVAIPNLVIGFQDHFRFHSPLLAITLALCKTVMVLGLLQAWWPNAALFWNGPSWSLSAELFFYLMFPFLLKALKRRSSWFLLALIAFATGVDILSNTAFQLNHNPIWSFSPLVRISAFATGMALRLLFQRHGPTTAWFGGIALGVLYWTLSTTKLPLPISVSLIHISLAGLVYSLAVARHLPRPIWPMRVLLLLGQASFAMYLFHLPLLYLWRQALPVWQPWHLCGFLALVVGFSVLVFQYLETPLRLRVRKAFSSKQP